MKHQTPANSPLARFVNRTTMLPALLVLTIFLLPSNWFLKLDPTTGYVHGLQVDYLIPKLYASIVSAGVFAAVWSWQQRSVIGRELLKLLSQLKTVFSFVILSLKGAKPPKTIASPLVIRNVVMLFLIALVVARQFFTAEPISSVWFLLQILVVLWFGTAVYHQRKLLEHPLVLSALIATLLFQLMLGGYQFLTQRSLMGYWLLGESNLSQSIGLATHVFDGAELVLAYGTTPHPNVLAGIVIAYLWILWMVWRKFDSATSSQKTQVLSRVLITTAGLGVLYITQSLSAVAMAVSGGVLLLVTRSKLNEIAINRWLFWAACGIILTLPISLTIAGQFTENLSVDRRVTLNNAAIRMFADVPLIGVGVNNFTTQLENYAGSEVVRFVQPAHHVGVLFLAEVGIVGVALVVLSGRKLILARPAAAGRALFLLAIPLSLDHYLYTLAPGQLLLALVMVISIRTQRTQT
jgi:hypothetical protein